MELRSLKEYPKATKLEIPLSEDMAKRLFFARPHFKNMPLLRTWKELYNDISMPFTSWKLIGLGERFVQVRQRGPNQWEVDQLTLHERPMSDILAPVRPVARIYGKLNGFDRRLIIELLVPVPSLHTRSIYFLDWLRNYAAGIAVHFNTPDKIDKETRQLMKSLEEIEQMKKVLVSKGLAEDAAQDQAFKALMPANMQRWMRPDSLGGNAEDRKKAAERFAEVRRAKMKFGGRKTRRRPRKV